jgi:hypothetical protein
MTHHESPREPAPQSDIPEDSRLDFVLGRLDLVAVLITLLGLCLLGVTAAALAAVELAKLISCLWAQPLERWLLVIVGLAIVWVLSRGKRLCVV